MASRVRVEPRGPLQVGLLVLLSACSSVPAVSSAPPPAVVSAREPVVAQTGPVVDVVLLGTGTPIPDAARSGPATAVLAGGLPLLFDAGPGVVRRAQEAASLHSLPALEPGNLNHVFLTHLHSDHTTGLPDLLLGGWVLGRSRPVHVWGPPGTNAMVDGILESWRADIAIRQGVEDLPARGMVVQVVELSGGLAFDEEGTRVSAFPVQHGTWEVALGYRVQVGDRVVVISGDTAPSDAVVEACAGCALLVHEVYSTAGYDRVPDAGFHEYHGTFHTSGLQLGALAERAKPKQLVLTHQLFFGAPEASLLREVQMGFSGRVRSGADLDRIRVD
jgi:ribonuclease BN (tRNA processing enzyme)